METSYSDRNIEGKDGQLTTLRNWVIGGSLSDKGGKYEQKGEVTSRVRYTRTLARRQIFLSDDF